MFIKDYVDCVYNTSEENTEMAHKLIWALPSKRILELPRILLIKSLGTTYAVKVRPCVLNDKGVIDIEAIEKIIISTDYKLVTRFDLCRLNHTNWSKFNESIEYLIPFSSNIIIDMD